MMEDTIMTKPGWVKVVGIILIVMGCFGLLGVWQTFNMPKMMAMQRRMMPQLEEEMKKQAASRKASLEESEAVLKAYRESMQKMSDVPSWFNSWCLISGTIALSLSCFLIFTAINLFRLRKTAISMFYWVMGVDICFLIIRGVVGVTTMIWLGMLSMIVGSLAIITNIILLFVVANGSKQAFLERENS